MIHIHFSGNLLVKNCDKFTSPRNVACVGDDLVVVLDDVSFHAFQSNGTYIQSFLCGRGAMFRGLASYR